ncbi:MAG TPA: DUF1178 family protein [Stellaceae bacterium]|nr:DUF1178 family protein [Stellaceae bacterium]
MIRYELRCGADHEFEGWFRNSAGFDEQLSAGELTCPVCGATEIVKAPMAPAVTRSAPQIDPRTVLRALRKAVESNADNVGERFAEEARRIHYGETEARAIYGDATREETEALSDEGIEIAVIPWVPLGDA